MALEKLSANRVYGGVITKYRFKVRLKPPAYFRHSNPKSRLQSAALGGLVTQFNLFIPANASSTHKVPVLIYLAGLTCTEDTGCAIPLSPNP